jgi:NAD(P)H-dependent FMN reductase
MSNLKILVFAGSVRTGSLDEMLAAYCARQLRALGQASKSYPSGDLTDAANTKRWAA